jgi:hypothetical protein
MDALSACLHKKRFVTLFLFEQLVSKQGKLPFFGMLFNPN